MMVLPIQRSEIWETTLVVRGHAVLPDKFRGKKCLMNFPCGASNDLDDSMCFGLLCVSVISPVQVQTPSPK